MVQPASFCKQSLTFGSKQSDEADQLTELEPALGLITAVVSVIAFQPAFFSPLVILMGRPYALLLENVPNLLRVDEGHAIHTITTALTAAGYSARVGLLNASQWVPQHRERLFIAAFRADLSIAAAAFSWPLPLRRRKTRLREVLEQLSVERLEEYRLSSAQWRLVRGSLEFRKQPQWRLAQLEGEARTLRGSYRKSFSRFSEFVPTSAAQESLTYEDVAASPSVGGEEAEVEEGDGREDHVDGAGGDDDVGPSICGLEGDAEGGYDGGVTGESDGGGKPLKQRGLTQPSARERARALLEPARFYTERECARLQGFPEEMSIQGGKKYMQIGNAVCPQLVTAIGARFPFSPCL